MTFIPYAIPPITAMFFLQALPIPGGELPALGVSGLLATWMFYMYRQDRLQNEKALTDLTKDFMQIVQENTRALTTLTERLGDSPPLIHRAEK